MEQLKVFVCVGAPGSGKSTWADEWVSKNPNTVRVCPDVFRAKFGSGEGDQSVSAQAFSASKRAMGEALDAGKDVVFDATNMYRKSRKDFINIARGRGAQVIAMVFECTKETLLHRNNIRGTGGGRSVPELIIDNMLSRYQRPDETEFDEVTFVSKV